MRARAGRRYACWGCRPAPAPRAALQRTSVPHAPGQPWRMLRAWDSRCGAAAWAYATRASCRPRGPPPAQRSCGLRAPRVRGIHTRHTAHMGFHCPSVRACSALCVRLDTTLHTSHCKRDLARQILWRLTRARCNAHGHVSARSTSGARQRTRCIKRNNLVLTSHMPASRFHSLPCSRLHGRPCRSHAAPQASPPPQHAAAAPAADAASAAPAAASSSAVRGAAPADAAAAAASLLPPLADAAAAAAAAGAAAWGSAWGGACCIADISISGSVWWQCRRERSTFMRQCVASLKCFC